jgi:hypothetical protein
MVTVPLFLAAAVAWLVTATAGWASAPTFRDLMNPRMFPEPQCGMTVERASLTGQTWQVVTTGARITADLRRGEVRFEQRIGHTRQVATLRLGTPLAGGRMTHAGPGLARAVFTHPRITVRVNGDSLFMLHTREPVTAVVESRILPAWFDSYQSNHLVVDEWGGVGLYCSEPDLDDEFDPYAPTVATYRLPAGSVLWVGVCPPKPYPWERSLRDNVVWHHSRELAYPPDEVLKRWSAYGNIVLLQSEIMLWKDWNLDFVPRLGAAEFARVRTTTHDLGMRFIVYTSPYYFIKGTPLESRAINTYDNFTDYPPGSGTGENYDLFIAAIERLLKEHRPDGLYFDGQYLARPAALYALARRARQLLGEDGILEWHSTLALGPGHCYLPQADAYVDYILRGEGDAKLYASFDYLRFFVSGYNVSNSIGVLCNNDGTLNPDLARRVLEANARFHTIASWLDQPRMMEVIERDYRPLLTPALRDAVDAAADARQAQVPARVAARRAELEKRAAAYRRESAELQALPDWGAPRLSLAFETLPAVAQIVSSQNPNPFATEDGVLRIRAHAHTYALLSCPLTGEARGLVVRLRQGTDQGMSWGPAVMLRFANGAKLRIGTRSDGTLQADMSGLPLEVAEWPDVMPGRAAMLAPDIRDVQIVGGSYDARDWIWLRARWTEHWGVVERSADGQTYETVWRFSHDRRLAGPVTAALVGKVPYNGVAADFSVAGDLGECEIGLVQVY